MCTAKAARSVLTQVGGLLDLAIPAVRHAHPVGTATRILATEIRTAIAPGGAARLALLILASRGGLGAHGTGTARLSRRAARLSRRAARSWAAAEPCPTRAVTTESDATWRAAKAGTRARAATQPRVGARARTRATRARDGTRSTRARRSSGAGHDRAAATVVARTSQIARARIRKQRAGVGLSATSERRPSQHSQGQHRGRVARPPNLHPSEGGS